MCFKFEVSEYLGTTCSLKLTKNREDTEQNNLTIGYQQFSGQFLTVFAQVDKARDKAR